jgi:hypothetical protein
MLPARTFVLMALPLLWSTSEAMAMVSILYAIVPLSLDLQVNVLIPPMRLIRSDLRISAQVNECVRPCLDGYFPLVKRFLC